MISETQVPKERQDLKQADGGYQKRRTRDRVAERPEVIFLVGWHASRSDCVAAVGLMLLKQLNRYQRS